MRAERGGRRWRRARHTALSVALALVLAACGDDRSQDALDPQGPVARKLQDLVVPVFLVAGVIFVLVEGLIIVAAIKFRRRSEDEAPRQIHGNAALELGWTIAPAVILAFVAVLTVATLVDINKTPKGPDVLQVTVTGHQWWWEYEYPQHDVVTANELHIPIDRKVAVTLKSVDVIHSFWPPKLAGKVDVIPNRTNRMVIEAEKPGTYFGQCAEFCGLSHANMRLRVIAHAQPEFDEWVESNAEPALLPGAEQGEEASGGALLFRQKGCGSCHTVRGFTAGRVGPDLTHLQQRKTFAGAIFDLNEQNLRKWLRDPPGEKPGSIMPNLELSEEEITKLLAYLATLK